MEQILLVLRGVGAMTKNKIRVGIVLKSVMVPLISIIIGWSIFIAVVIFVLKLLNTDIVFVKSEFYESILKTIISLAMVAVWLISWHYATKYLRNKLIAMK